VFGAEIEVAQDAPVTDRLLGFLSRQANPRAVVVPAARAELLDLPNGSMIRLGVDVTDTGGELSVHRTTLRDGADGAFPHHHDGSTEMFYVVSGSLQILIGDEVVVARPGDIAVVPPHTTHAFAAAPGCDAEVVVAITPGQSFEFFRRLSRIATGKEEPGSFFADQSPYDIYGDDSPTWSAARAR
jgi:mannose-6-phosphate isomerase-like protein (cupin superfamily)